MTAEKANILIVDDQPGKILSYEALLNELDENILTATSASEALDLLLRNEVAVILVDVCMPDLDGFELARMIRDHPRFRKVAIIFVSAIHLAQADLLKGYDVGAMDYLPVPVVPELLRAKVRVFIELYRKTKQLEQLNEELERRVKERTAALESSNARLVQSEAGRTLALSAGQMGSWTYHVTAGQWDCDEGLSRIARAPRVASFSGRLDVERFIEADDRTALKALLGRVTPEDNTFLTELRLKALDGTTRHCLVAAAATFDADGGLARVDGVTTDITDRKLAEQTQLLLAREVDHRARNALATVQAIVRLTRETNVNAYMEAVENRVRALAKTHDLLSSGRWRGADIRMIVRDEMAPYDTGRVRIDGPSVLLKAEPAQILSLSLHELATNAAKYGALSSAAGHVAVQWRLEGAMMSLTWVESGGPPVAAPTRTGFGTQIVRAGINPSRGEDVQFHWHASGLRCEITINCSDQPVVTPAPPAAVRARAAAKRILVVEDEVLVGMLTCSYLEALGYDPLGPIASIEEAQQVVMSDLPDAAVLDVSLSGRLVYPLADWLAKRSVPIVFVTGFGSSGIDAAYKGYPVISKPFEQDAISGVLLSMLVPPTDELKASA